MKDSKSLLIEKDKIYELVTGRKKTDAVFTIKPHHHSDLFSIKELYMDCGDVTEHKFVKKHFKSDWAAWRDLEELLTGAVLTEDPVSDWRIQLEAKLKSEMIDILIKDARDPESKTATSNAKWLASLGWKEKKDKIVAPTRTTSRTMDGGASLVAKDFMAVSDDIALLNRHRKQ